MQASPLCGKGYMGALHTLDAESASTTRPAVTPAQLMVLCPGSAQTASAPEDDSRSRDSSVPSPPSSTDLTALVGGDAHYMAI